MEILWITLLTIIASAVGTITGFGISTVMVPIVLFFYPLPETLLLVGIIHWFGDLWKMFLFKHGINWKILFFFGIPGILTGIVGAYLVFKLPESLLSQIVVGLLIAYVIFLMLRPKFKLRPSATVATLGGAGSGFLGGISGVGGGALRAVVLTAFNLPKAVYIFTSGLLGFVIDASRIGTYIFGGTKIPTYLIWGFLVFIPASFIGAKIGKVVADKIPEKKFRFVIAIFLFLVGVKFLFFP